jgi:poly [ADP-ribose] polymerase
MGKYYIPTSSGRGSYPVPGYDSTWAKAGQSGVINHEMIIYKLNQCNLTYLVEFSA